MKPEPEQWEVISPDAIPIRPEPFETHDQACAALTAWCQRFERQGYYSSVDGRIPIIDLPDRCSIRRVES